MASPTEPFTEWRGVRIDKMKPNEVKIALGEAIRMLGPMLSLEPPQPAQVRVALDEHSERCLGTLKDVCAAIEQGHAGVMACSDSMTETLVRTVGVSIGYLPAKPKGTP